MSHSVIAIDFKSCGTIAIALVSSVSSWLLLQIMASVQLLSLIAGYHAIACTSCSVIAITFKSRSTIAIALVSRSIIEIALAKHSIRAIAFTNRSTIAITLAQIMANCDCSCVNRGTIAIALAWIVAPSQMLSANRGIRAIALANRRVLRELSRPDEDLISENRRHGFLWRKKAEDNFEDSWVIDRRYGLLL